VPINFNTTELRIELAQHNICVETWLPSDPGDNPVRNLLPGDVGPNSHISRDGDESTRKAYESCRNPDKYIFAYRAVNSINSNEAWATWLLGNVVERISTFKREVKAFFPGYFPWTSQPWWGDKNHRKIMFNYMNSTQHKKDVVRWSRGKVPRQSSGFPISTGIVFLGVKDEWTEVKKRSGMLKKDREAEEEEARRQEWRDNTYYRNNDQTNEGNNNDQGQEVDKKAIKYGAIREEDEDHVNMWKGRKKFKGFSRVSQKGNNVYVDEVYFYLSFFAF
jgi:hypothetical protein